MHESMKGVVVERVIRVIGYGLLAVGSALVMSDLAFSESSRAGELLVASVALVSVSAVGFTVLRTAQRAARAVASLQRDVLQALLEITPPGAVRAELACAMGLDQQLRSRSTNLNAFLGEFLSAHPQIELRPGVRGDFVLDAQAAASALDRLVWDATEAGARRVLIGTKETKGSIVFVVIDDGQHRDMPVALLGLQRLGRIGLVRRYEGGCVASTVEVGAEAAVAELAQKPRAALLPTRSG